MLDSLSHMFDPAASWPLLLVALFLGPFVREDVAIVLGGLMIVERQIPVVPVAAGLYAGIIASDFLLFGLGRLSRRSTRVRRLLVTARAEQVTSLLLGNLPVAMIVARIVPGTIAPVYIGAGAAGARIAVFAPITLLTAAIYLGTVLWIVVRFGEEVLSGIGYWGWILTLALLVLTATYLARHPPLGLVRRAEAMFGAKGPPETAEALIPRQEPGLTHAGMPPLRGLARHVGAAERIPPKLFYVPLAANWLWLALRYHSLSLPALVNPLIEVGGLWGESKRVYLDMVSGEERRWLARYVTLERRAGNGSGDLESALDLAKGAGLTFPLVAKPDIGWQGYGVRPVESEEALWDYVRMFPAGAEMMLQEMIPWDAEAGVFYVRTPGAATGKVVAMTLRYFPHVLGDGVRTVRQLILDDQRASWKAGLHLGRAGLHSGIDPAMLDRVPVAGEIVRLSFIGSIRVGGLYRDADGDITPALSRRFDGIAQSMPEFYYARFDIRFASMDRLREGEDFRIIEINGAGSESISAWDPEVPVGKVYRRLAAHQKMLFEIGALNRARGWKPPGAMAILRAARRQSDLIGKYPPSC